MVTLLIRSLCNSNVFQQWWCQSKGIAKENHHVLKITPEVEKGLQEPSGIYTFTNRWWCKPRHHAPFPQLPWPTPWAWLPHSLQIKWAAAPSHPHSREEQIFRFISSQNTHMYTHADMGALVCTHVFTCKGLSWGWLTRWCVFPSHGADWTGHNLLRLWVGGTRQGNWVRENSSRWYTWEGTLDLKVKTRHSVKPVSLWDQTGRKEAVVWLSLTQKPQAQRNLIQLLLSHAFHLGYHGFPAGQC